MALPEVQRPAPESKVVDLERPFILEHSLEAELVELGKFKTRSDLERSELYRRLYPTIEALSFGMEYGRASRPSAPASVPPSVRVVAWNIQRGTRLEGVREALAGDAELARADVILLMESDLGMGRSGNRNVARELSGQLGFDYVYGNSYLGLAQGNRRDTNTLALSGNAILSRLPLERAENFTVSITKDKFESSEKRLGHKKALWAQITVGTASLAVCAVHLDSGASSAQRALQLADVVQKLEQRGVAHRSLIGGDFNTTTYDAQSRLAVLRSLGQKLRRGGFSHAIEHYLEPGRLYERQVFRVLENAGYDFESYNQRGVGTVFYRVGDPGSEARVRDFVPQPFVEVLHHKLEPYGGAVGLRLDWFAGKGLQPQRAGTVPLVQRGLGVSDHDPIWVDVEVCP